MKYLYEDKYNGLRKHEIIKETKNNYYINNGELKIPKTTMSTGKGYFKRFFHLPTEVLDDTYERQMLLSNLCKKFDLINVWQMTNPEWLLTVQHLLEQLYTEIP